MADQTTVGVFGSVKAAERARAALIDYGVGKDRILLSTHLTQDAIAAEAPGQSYEHQSYRGSDKATALGWLHSLLGRKATTDTDRARYNEAIRTATCLLSVDQEGGGDSEERKHIEELMHKNGARITMERPSS
jgi:hypothetical protein